MSEELRPDGTPVSIGGVEVSALGLGGRVEVHLPGSPGMRAAEEMQPVLRDALSRGGYIEQLTVEISEPRLYPEFATGSGRGRSEAGQGPTLSVKVPNPGKGFGQVLLACEEDGTIAWRVPPAGPSDTTGMRDTGQLTYQMPGRIAERSPAGKRGLVGAVGTKLLKVLAFEVVDRLLGAIGDSFVSRYEQRWQPHRLRAVTADNYQDGAVGNLEASDLGRLTPGRALLFIHGTASRTHKAFATLPRDFVSNLVKRYGGRVFALDHPTLSVTPVDNVRWLAQALGGRTLELDVVAHSRGGLVGRVMCERPSEAGLDPARVNVRTLVMVATPNAGTPLADRKHLGAFVDALTNILEFIPDNPATDTLDVVLALLKQIAVGALGGLDGLQSMDPGGAFLRQTLNQPSSVRAVYRGIAADYEPAAQSPLGRYARDFLTDLVFRGAPNDLVVPTDGVYAANGATPFPLQDVVRLETAEAVDHSGFWNRPAPLKAMDRWLSPPEQPVT